MGAGHPQKQATRDRDDLVEHGRREPGNAVGVAVPGHQTRLNLPPVLWPALLGLAAVAVPTLTARALAQEGRPAIPGRS